MLGGGGQVRHEHGPPFGCGWLRHGREHCSAGTAGTRARGGCHRCVAAAGARAQVGGRGTHRGGGRQSGCPRLTASCRLRGRQIPGCPCRCARLV